MNHDVLTPSLCLYAQSCSWVCHPSSTSMCLSTQFSEPHLFGFLMEASLGKNDWLNLGSSVINSNSSPSSLSRGRGGWHWKLQTDNQTSSLGAFQKSPVNMNLGVVERGLLRIKYTFISYHFGNSKGFRYSVPRTGQ